MDVTTNNMSVGGVYQGQGSSNVSAAAATEPAKETTKVEISDRPINGTDGKTATNEQIHKAVQEINKKANGSEAIFGIDDNSNRVYIKIVDKESQKTILQYPAEETLKLIAKVWDQEGLAVDEKR